nr:hypothetical protein [Pseudopedobacter sp.]
MQLIIYEVSIRNRKEKLVKLNLEIMKFKKILVALIITASFTACKKDKLTTPAPAKAINPISEKAADY